MSNPNAVAHATQYEDVDPQKKSPGVVSFLSSVVVGMNMVIGGILADCLQGV
jgi:hypothetical protein